ELPRCRNFVPKFLSAHCFRSVFDVRSRSASGAFSDYHSLSTLREPSPATCCKSETAESSPAQVFPRRTTQTAFLVLRDNGRLPIVVSWRATKTTFVSVPARSAIVVAGR